MEDRNISGFSTNNSTSGRELRQSVEAKVTEIAMPERCGCSSSSKGVVCGRLSSMHGRKTDSVQWLRAITPDDHIPGSKILHRDTKRVKFHSALIVSG
jgi:hypothetical protein